MVQIRYIAEDDAEKFLNLCKQLDQETEFMMLEPDERPIDVQQQTNRLRSIISSGNSMIFVAEQDGELIGYLGAQGGTFRRPRHKVHIVVGILQAFIGKGIGTALFTEMEKWARKSGAHRLELTVMVHNDRGVALYKKMGFDIEGISKDSLLVDGTYVDEYYMAKILR